MSVVQQEPTEEFRRAILERHPAVERAELHDGYVRVLLNTTPQSHAFHPWVDTIESYSEYNMVDVVPSRWWPVSRSAQKEQPS